MGLKLLSFTALGVALHFLWRWHRRSHDDFDQEQENRPEEGQQREVNYTINQFQFPRLDIPGLNLQSSLFPQPLLDSLNEHPATSLHTTTPIDNHAEQPPVHTKPPITAITTQPTIAAAPAHPELPPVPLFPQYTEVGTPTANITAADVLSSPSLEDFYSPAASSVTPEADFTFAESNYPLSPNDESPVGLPPPPPRHSAGPPESPFFTAPEGLISGDTSAFLGVAFPAFADDAGMEGSPEGGAEGVGFQGGTLTAAGALMTPPPPAPLAKMDRSFTLHSAASDRRLARVIEESESDDDSIDPHMRQSMDIGVRLALKLDVIAGPRVKTSYVTGEDTTEMHIGRAPDNDLVIPDGEVSGKHAHVSWSSLQRCWQIVDLGSLNGTSLNGESISTAGRVRGEEYRLCSDDIITLGTLTKLKVSVFPREMLPENAFDRSLSLSLGPGSLPRSLTMPKHRIPSFTSLLTPKINSPSKQAVVAAASDELRLECCIAAATGRDHARRNQACEDVALAECPLHGSDMALGPGSIAALFCVFDGHCGRGAADAASIALPDEVSDRVQTAEGAAGLLSGEGARDLLHDAFLATDRRINSEEGCTATAVLAWRAPDGSVLLQCGNVGDSAAVLIDVESGTWKVLTEDHRLTNPAERDRLARNGIPLHSDSKRLYGLNLARALGDKFLKDEDLGLSAEPSVSDVVSVPLHEGALLVIASDGLWDVLDSEKLAGIAAAADKEEDGSVVEIAAAIVAAAKKSGTRDDVTALVVRLWPEEEWELRSPLMTLDDGQVASFEAP